MGNNVIFDGKDIKPIKHTKPNSRDIYKLIKLLQHNANKLEIR